MESTNRDMNGHQLPAGSTYWKDYDASHPLAPKELGQEAHDRAAKEWQEAALKESEFVSKRADNLHAGMTLKEASAVLYRGVLTGEAFGFVSSTAGANGKLEVYRTTCLGGYPDVWLTFYNGKLQSWTVMPQT